MKFNVRDMTLAALFAALMVIGAFIKIPLPLVPITFQPFFCVFAGILLGSRLGMTSQLIYVIMGLIGIPVFTSGGGITYIFQPSFGYIIGFVLGAYVVGKVSETLGEMNLIKAVISVTSGLVVIYAIGIPYVYLIVRFYLGKPEAAFAAATKGIALIMLKDFILFLIIAFTANKVVPLVRSSRRTA